MRLGRGHRELGKRRWDEPLQRHLADAGMEIPCYDVASDRIVWNSLELAFAARTTRRSVDSVPCHAAQGRFLVAYLRIRLVYCRPHMSDTALAASQRKHLAPEKRAGAAWETNTTHGLSSVWLQHFGIEWA